MGYLMKVLEPKKPKGQEECDLIHHAVRYNVASGQLKTVTTLDELKDRQIEYVRVMWLDLVNHVKSRIVPLEYFEKLLGTSRPGVATAKAALGIVFIALAPGFGPTGEYLFAFDLTTLRICPHVPGHASILGWFEEKHPRRPKPGYHALEVDLCPRTILRRAVENAKSMGVEFLIGFESEFILLTKTSPTIEVVNAHGWCSSAAFPSGAIETQVLKEIGECLKASGIELQTYHSEAAPGQYEVVTGPLSALQAVDALAHTRDIIFNVASKHGLRATLAPRISEDNCGSATHTHISIHSANKDKPSSVHSNLSYIESTFLAGLLQNLPSLALLALPTTASYQRMIDGIWSGGTYVCWGTDNREAPVRLCNAFSAPARNFEIKCLDGTANPYLAVASFISAGMDGVSKGIECQLQDCSSLEPETTAANMGEDNRKKLGITGRMPLTWQAARSAFDESELVDTTFGSNFKTKYLNINNTLAEQMALCETEEERLTKWVETY